MKIMVAGGAGYIGAVVTRRLQQAGHDVAVIDNLSTGHADNVVAAPLFELPISRAGEVLDDSYDAVVHLAASALVAESVAKPELYWRNNVVEGVALLEAMRVAGVGRFLFSSTCATYGEPASLPITEDTPTAPVNSYGATKLALDHAITSYSRAHGLAAISFRYFNVGGAYGELRERHDPESHLIPNLLRGATGGSFTLYGTDYDTRDGTAVRDYIHVLDISDAHEQALDVLEPGVHHIVNLGSGDGTTNREVLGAVQDVTGHQIEVLEAARRPGDPPALVADHARATALLGWTPKRGLRAQIQDAWNALQG